ncbi:MAG TPA: 50S ribosomal protein L10 [Candidatus Saccharimonadales bacterium]
MAINREKKAKIVADLVEAFNTSKLTVFANYEGLSVAEAQELRAVAKDNGSEIKVVKNRLVKVALKQSEQLKEVDAFALTGQLLYVFNPQDDVAPAQMLAGFAKQHPAIKLIGGWDSAGLAYDQITINQLAELPNKDQLRGILVSTLAAPATGLVNVLAGNIRGLLRVLKARADLN